MGYSCKKCHCLDTYAEFDISEYLLKKMALWDAYEDIDSGGCPLKYSDIVSCLREEMRRIIAIKVNGIVGILIRIKGIVGYTFKKMSLWSTYSISIVGYIPI